MARTVGKDERVKELGANWDGRELGFGEGRSKKEAETAAARDALGRELWKAVAGSPSTEAENLSNNSPITPNNTE